MSQGRNSKVSHDNIPTLKTSPTSSQLKELLMQAENDGNAVLVCYQEILTALGETKKYYVKQVNNMSAKFNLLINSSEPDQEKLNEELKKLVDDVIYDLKSVFLLYMKCLDFLVTAITGAYYIRGSEQLNPSIKIIEEELNSLSDAFKFITVIQENKDKLLRHFMKSNKFIDDIKLYLCHMDGFSDFVQRIKEIFSCMSSPESIRPIIKNSSRDLKSLKEMIQRQEVLIEKMNAAVGELGSNQPSFKKISDENDNDFNRRLNTFLLTIKKDISIFLEMNNSIMSLLNDFSNKNLNRILGAADQTCYLFFQKGILYGKWNEIVLINHHWYQKLLERIAAVLEEINVLSVEVGSSKSRSAVLDLLKKTTGLIQPEQGYIFHEGCVNKLIVISHNTIFSALIDNTLLFSLGSKVSNVVESLTEALLPKKTIEQPRTILRRPPRQKSPPRETPPDLPKEFSGDDVRTFSFDQLDHAIEKCLETIKKYRQSLRSQMSFIQEILHIKQESVIPIVMLYKVYKQSILTDQYYQQFTQEKEMIEKLKPTGQSAISLAKAMMSLKKDTEQLVNLNQALDERKKISDERRKITSLEDKKQKQKKSHGADLALMDEMKNAGLNYEDLSSKITSIISKDYKIIIDDSLTPFINQSRASSAKHSLPSPISQTYSILLKYIDELKANGSLNNASVKLVGSTIDAVYGGATEEIENIDIDFRIEIPKISDEEVQRQAIAFISNKEAAGQFDQQPIIPRERPHLVQVFDKQGRRTDIELTTTYQPLFTIHEVWLDENGALKGNKLAKKDFTQKILRPVKAYDLKSHFEKNSADLFIIIKYMIKGYTLSDELKHILDSVLLNEIILKKDQELNKYKINDLYRRFDQKFLDTCLKAPWIKNIISQIDLIDDTEKLYAVLKENWLNKKDESSKPDSHYGKSGGPELWRKYKTEQSTEPKKLDEKILTANFLRRST